LPITPPLSPPSDDDLLESYRFELPPDRIAERPCPQRDACRLLTLDRKTGATADAVFTDLPDLLPAGALLVANDTKVAPVRLLGRKPTGGAVEFLLTTPVALLRASRDPASGWFVAPASGLLRISRPPRPGDRLEFAPDLALTVPKRGDFGHTDVLLTWQGALPDILGRIGHVPLPPYIHRADDADDRTTYQTVYARDDKLGSAAAPTAGLHFTEALLARLGRRGFGFATRDLPCRHRHLFPGPGRGHSRTPHARGMDRGAGGRGHRRGQGQGRGPGRRRRGHHRRPHPGGRLRPKPGPSPPLPGRPTSSSGRATASGSSTAWSRISICQGSSLVIMLAALAGRHTLLAAYRRAIDAGYRFFSYGDAMLVL